MTNKEIRQVAWDKLKNNFGEVFIAIFIVSALTSAASSFSFGIATLLITGPLQVGLCYYLLSVLRGSRPKLEELFNGFKQFVRNFTAFLLVMLYVFLWSLLFIIPGIIKAYSYKMTFYILADDPNISARDAMALSENIMNGNKMRLFGLQLSFFGWFLLVLITFGLALIWVGPYMQMAETQFYNELVMQLNPNNNQEEEVETAY